MGPEKPRVAPENGLGAVNFMTVFLKYHEEKV
jgi:hypothetical protein